MQRFAKKIENPFVKSFLAYVPYAVLAAMTFPAVLDATGSTFSAGVGLVVAILLSLFGQGLIVVALGGCAAVFLAEQLLLFI